MELSVHTLVTRAQSVLRIVCGDGVQERKSSMGKRLALILKLIILNAASRGSEHIRNKTEKQFFNSLFDELWGELKEEGVVWSEAENAFILKKQT